MALIIKNREIVEDNWQVVRAAEDGALPEVAALPAGKVLVPFALWQAGGDALVASRSKDEIGVWLEPDSEPADIAGDFDKLALIGVDFPVFRDGRGFSIGRCRLFKSVRKCFNACLRCMLERCRHRISSGMV